MPTEQKITICLDFDLSITANHLHNECYKISEKLRESKDEAELQKYKNDPDDYLWNKLNELNLLVTFGKPEDWKEFINSYLTDEYNFSITTRSAYPKIVKRFLEEIIKVDITKFHIEAGNTSAPDKTGHMQRTLKHFNQEIIDDSLAGAILLDDTDESFEVIESMGGRAIKLPGDENNLAVAKEKLPQEIANAKNEIAKAEKMLIRKQQLQDDKVRREWLSDKLLLASRIFDNLNTTESNTLFIRTADDADGNKILFQELVTELEEFYVEQQTQLSKTPWEENIFVPDLINENPTKLHLVRMVALILKDVYLVYPDVKNNHLSAIIDSIKDVPDGYKVSSRKGNIYLTEVENKTISPLTKNQD